MKKRQPTQAEFLKTARTALTAAKGFEKKAGQCKRLVRQVEEASGLDPSLCLPAGLDASESARWIRKNRPEQVVRGGGLPGDVYCYEIGHGPHGHMGIRDFGNVLMENSVAHAPEGEEDGRGVRALSKVGTPTLIFRPWKG